MWIFAQLGGDIPQILNDGCTAEFQGFTTFHWQFQSPVLGTEKLFLFMLTHFVLNTNGSIFACSFQVEA